jgi:hypothetical protein
LASKGVERQLARGELFCCVDDLSERQQTTGSTFKIGTQALVMARQERSPCGLLSASTCALCSHMCLTISRA